MKKMKLLWVILAGLLLLLTGCGSKKDKVVNGDPSANYPSKPIQLIVPLKAGGDTDYNARVLAKYLQKYIGKPVVVTNINGGATVTGMKKVLDGKADGYSVIVNGTDIFVPKMLGNTDITLDSFKTVGISHMDNTTVLVANKASGWKNIDDLVKASQAKPGTIEYGMKIGATNNIFGVAMGKEWGTKLNNVDVGNNASKMVALLAKQTDVINISYALVKDYIKSGEFVPLALLGSKKNPLLPNLPLAQDQGYKNLDFSKFFWLGMNPKTPDSIVNKFSAALKKATEDPEYIKAMEANALTVDYMGPKEGHDFAIKLYNDTMKPYKEEFLKQQ